MNPKNFKLKGLSQGFFEEIFCQLWILSTCSYSPHYKKH